jgi:glucose/arabinose dehydrogenase
MSAWPALLVSLMLATQLVETRGCSSDTPESTTPESPATTPATVTPDDVVSTADGVRFRVETMASGLDVPWSIAFAPDGRVFVTERPGRIRIVNFSTAQAVLALALEDVYAQGEAGLLGLALDPQFAENAWVYLYYTAAVPTGRPVNRIARYREVGGQLVERVVLLDDIPAATIHDGGRIRFGPDGLLYISTGDAAAQDSAQDVASQAGKILRLNRDGTAPPANPFGPVYSYGHRNPQGFDWHPSTGELWASEHGSSGNDEINIIAPGANHGWPRIEGAATLPGMESPITFYNPAVAPSGAAFYRGQRFPQFVNNLFIATLRGTHLRRLRLDPASPRRIAAEERLLDGTFGRLRDVVSGPDGYLYILTNNRDGRGSPTASDDRILRLVPAA